MWVSTTYNHDDVGMLLEAEFKAACLSFESSYSAATIQHGCPSPFSEVKLGQAHDSMLGEKFYLCLRREIPIAGQSEAGPMKQDSDFGDYELSEQETQEELSDLDCQQLSSPDQFATRNGPYVLYEIHFHETYQCPYMFISLHNLPDDMPPKDLDTLYQLLIPQHLHDTLRRTGLGPTGAVTLQEHPLTHLPTFCLHPCMTNAALGGLDTVVARYIQTYLSVVGPNVGIFLPAELVACMDDVRSLLPLK